MKPLHTPFLGLLLVTFISTANAQITNLVVNDSSSHFTMASGDTISWSFNIAVGGTAICEIWYDINLNGSIDSAADRLYTAFSQTDGDMNGNGGPPDLDGAVDGHESVALRIGLAPGSYIMKFSHNHSSAMVRGTITPLLSPIHTISGHVTPPPGKSAQYIFVTMEAQGQGSGMFWDGVTNASGDYTIKMDADTSGNPWRLRIQQNPFPPCIILPEDSSLIITANHAGYNFTCFAAAAQVAGLVLDETGAPLPNSGANLNRNDTTNFYRRTRPDAEGFFQIGILANELTPASWILRSETNGDWSHTTTEMQAYANISAINPGDSLFKTLRVYSTNSIIRGTVTLDGGPPGYSILIMAASLDTAIAYTMSDSTTGNFSLNVSDKLGPYSVYAAWIPSDWTQDPTTARAGDSTVVLRIRSRMWASVNCRSGWNMLSLPVITDDAHKSALFPSATTQAFYYVSGSGYRTDSLLHRGQGYWLKFNDTSSVWMNGTAFSRETLNVLPGWNMIAPPTPGIPASNIIAVGTTVTTPFYGYSGSYFTTTFLNAGSAFWVKMSSAGQLIMNANTLSPWNAFKPAPGSTPSEDNPKDLRRLSFTDATGEIRSLCFVTRPPDRDPASYEAPPPPPSGIMDVRFASQQFLEHASGKAMTNLPIRITSAVYPVKIGWNDIPEHCSAAIVIDGKSYDVSGTREIMIPSAHSAVELVLGAHSANEMPKSYVLGQNYPNPFNPSTAISYDLAGPSKVRLTLFNTLGEQVAVIVDESQEAGSYRVEFTPSGLPSGVYYYRLTAGEFTAVRKLLFIK